MEITEGCLHSPDISQLTFINEKKADVHGAGNEIRTRDTKLGKLVLYHLSYARILTKTNIKLRQKYLFVNIFS